MLYPLESALVLPSLVFSQTDRYSAHMELVTVTMATFWVWETVRAVVERFAPSVFSVTRPIHPVLAALLPLYVLWPHWVAALAVAGVVGLLVATVDRLFSSTPVQQVHLPRGRMQKGLPPLP